MRGVCLMAYGFKSRLSHHVGAKSAPFIKPHSKSDWGFLICAPLLLLSPQSQAGFCGALFFLCKLALRSKSLTVSRPGILRPALLPLLLQVVAFVVKATRAIKTPKALITIKQADIQPVCFMGIHTGNSCKSKHERSLFKQAVGIWDTSIPYRPYKRLFV